MNKICLFLIVVLFSCISFAEQTGQLQLPAGTPLFSNKELRGQPAFLRQDSSALLHGISDSRITIGALYKNTKVLQITFPQLRGVFYTPDNIDVKYDPASGRGQFSFSPDLSLMSAGAGCLIAAILLLIYWIRTDQGKCRKYLPLLFITLLQWGLVLYIVGYTANIMLVTIDDHYYFKIAWNLMHFDFSEKFNYTIGFPAFFMPFLLFASTFEQIHIPFCIFNAMVVMPFLLCMVYLIIRKLSDSRIAVGTLLFWFLMVLFYHHRYYHSGADTALETYIMKAFPTLPSLTFSYSMYELIVMLGYNSVSDTPSCALVLGCFASILYMKPKLRNLTAFSFLFGFACLVRLNNILFAPLFAFALYRCFENELKTWKKWSRFLLTGAVPFLLMILIQCIINKIQLGGFFTSPYSLHGYANITKGFMFQMLPFGVPFLETCNHAWFVLGTVSLFTMKVRDNRICLSLLTMPLVLFFFGYPVIFTNATRFLLPAYFGFSAALLIQEFWQCGLMVKVRGAVIIGASIFLTAPGGSEKLAKYLPWNWNLCGMSIETAAWIRWGICLICLLILGSFFYDLKKNTSGQKELLLQCIVFFTLFLFLFYAAVPWLTAFLMLFVLCRALADVVTILIKNTNRIEGAK